MIELSRAFHLDLATGRFAGQEPTSRRTVGELAGIFESIEGEDPGRVVYETYGCPAEIEGPPQLLFATTVLYPGAVNGEYPMTRGHFHTDPSRGEFMAVLEGEGKLLLMERDRTTWAVPLTKGTVVNIDGRHAHRVANTGSVPLVFLVAWMSDCGHDYGTILSEGFGLRLRTP